MINCVNVNSDNLSYGRTEWFVNDRYNSGAIMPGYFTPISSERCVYQKRKTWKDVPDSCRSLFDMLNAGWTWTDIKDVVSSLCNRMDEEGLSGMSRKVNSSDFSRGSVIANLYMYSVEKVLINFKKMAAMLSMAMIDMDRPVRDFCINVISGWEWNSKYDCMNDTAYLHIIEKKRNKSKLWNL